jgi:hypothetical protein
MLMEQQGYEIDGELSLEKYEEIVQRSDKAMLGY